MFTGFQRPFYVLDGSTTYRVSSWDRAGKNNDYITLQPGKSYTLAELRGPGCIKHFYCTMINPSRLIYRKAILRIWWDNEKTPSVEVPLGDFFCISNCSVRPVNSLMMVINPGSTNMYTHGLNCYFPMPFAKSARIELEYQVTGDGDGSPVNFWYHIEVEHPVEMSFENVGYFHTQWRRENPTKSTSAEFTNVALWDGANLDGTENYVILEAKGKGQVAGLHLQVDNVAGGWYGEGDDMIFIDGEKWPPSYPGTGTEEIFGGGACPNVEYSGIYTGFHLISNAKFSGKNAMYRWYIHDPIKFQRAVKMTIEHGHANNFENDYSSVAYWYQMEPHAPFPQLLPVERRIPRFPEAFFAAERKKVELNRWQEELATRLGVLTARRVIQMLRSKADLTLNEGRFEDACYEFDRIFNQLGPLIRELRPK